MLGAINEKLQSWLQVQAHLFHKGKVNMFPCISLAMNAPQVYEKLDQFVFMCAVSANVVSVSMIFALILQTSVPGSHRRHSIV